MKKYTPGQKITSMDELADQDFIYIVRGEYSKIYHKGWLLSWPLRTALRYIEQGVIYKAVKAKEE